MRTDLLRIVLLLIIISSFIACTNAGNQQTLVVPPFETTSPKSEIVSTAIASPTSQVRLTESSSISTTESQGVPVEPLATDRMIRLESWSPDGEFFAYWAFDAEQLLDYSYPTGNLYFLNNHTGQICSYPEPGTYTGRTSLVWQQDGRLIILSSDPPRLGTPCGHDFVAVENPGNTLSNLPDLSLSPDGNHHAITRIIDANSFIAETSILRTQTDEVENTVRWKYQDAIGAPGDGQWLTANQFLINETIDQGPLLLTVGRNTTRVAEDIFGQSFNCGEDCHLVAKGAPISGTDRYHLILFGSGNVSNFPSIRLYHSESSEIEELSFAKGGFFSPDSKWLLLYHDVADPQSGENFQIWLRPVDPSDSMASFLTTTDINPFPPAWSPDDTKVAIQSSKGITVFLLSGRDLVGIWKTDDYKIIESLWSPDGQFLALRGDLPIPDSQEALFLVDIP